ncbi:ABC transporter substrate-binding protein [bacterium]|nr:MAG: ABC transporter substrate-binding protein [bacterium]
MSKKFFVFVVISLILVSIPLAEAQQPGKVPRIGFLRAAAAPESYIEALRQGLKELGYIEGKNIALEYRWGGGKTDQLPELAAELVRLKVDIFVTDGTPSALAARKASSTIPIVMASSGDPVGTRLIASLARPGGNITGLTSINAELGGKALELLKEIVPRLTHVAILGAEDSPVHKLFLKNTEAPARALGLKLIPLLFRGPDDYESAFRTATIERANAILVRGVPFTSSAHRKRLVDLAAKSRLPAIYETRDLTDIGGLISYGADRVDMYRRAATYVDKILKGTKPADLPVEQPMKFELVINLKAAKQIGLTIPPNVLARADRVIR